MQRTSRANSLSNWTNIHLIVFCFDVCKLYLSIPNDEGSWARKEALTSRTIKRIADEDVISMISLVFVNNNFLFPCELLDLQGRFRSELKKTVGGIQTFILKLSRQPVRKISINSRSFTEGKLGESYVPMRTGIELKVLSTSSERNPLKDIVSERKEEDVKGTDKRLEINKVYVICFAVTIF